MNIEDLIAGFDTNGVLGEYSGVTYPEADARTRAAVRALQELLAQGRARAAAEQRLVEIPAHAVSGTNGGDIYRVHPDGRAERVLEPFPEVERSFAATPCGGVAGAIAPLDTVRPLLLRCAYNGLWSPSGTNWQPVRCLELGPEEAAHAGFSPAPGGGLLVLCREHYDSILGDVAKLCGICQDSHAEDIDLGIWHLCAEQTARFHHASLETRRIAASDREHVAQSALATLERRLPRLTERGQTAARAIAGSLRAGRHIPVFFLELRLTRPFSLDPRAPGGIAPSDFDRLIEARSTQRVCSAAPLDEAEMLDLWRRSLPLLNAGTRPALDFPVFPREHPLVAAVGQAMHRAVEGGGDGRGLVGAACVQNLKGFLAACPELPEDLRAWATQTDCTQDVPLPARLVPPHLASRLCEGGQFREESGFLLDHRGRKLSSERLMKLVRLIARSFGKYFLSFKNTHPLLGILRYLDPGDPVLRRTLFFEAGRAVAAMTYLARARGFVSIIKSGPVELARDDLQALAAAHAPLPGTTSPPCPLLTFQLGLPLSPDERVCAGQPDEHDGLAERMLDRRAPRALLSEHYLPRV